MPDTNEQLVDDLITLLTNMSDHILQIKLSIECIMHSFMVIGTLLTEGHEDDATTNPLPSLECPECGGELKMLGDTSFCLDCDYDDMEILDNEST